MAAEAQPVEQLEEDLVMGPESEVLVPFTRTSPLKAGPAAGGDPFVRPLPFR
jgi:hypothetical protein